MCTVHTVAQLYIVPFTVYLSQCMGDTVLFRLLVSEIIGAGAVDGEGEGSTLTQWSYYTVVYSTVKFSKIMYSSIQFSVVVYHAVK